MTAALRLVSTLGTESEPAPVGRAWAPDCLNDEEIKTLMGVVKLILEPPAEGNIVDGAWWIRSHVPGKIAVEASRDDGEINTRLVIASADMVEGNDAGFGISGIYVERVPASDGETSDRFAVETLWMNIASSGGPERSISLLKRRQTWDAFREQTEVFAKLIGAAIGDLEKNSPLLRSVN